MLDRIHATAIVDPQAELARDVSIGPACVIQGAVSIAAGTRLLGHVYLQGPLTIGTGNVLYPFTCVGFAPQDRKFDAKVAGAGTVLGDQNVLREGVTIHRATGDQVTRIGDRNFFMANSHVGHDTVVGHDCTLANGVLVAGHCVIQDQVIFGGNAGVHQFCRIGRLAMVSGMASLSQDVPPFCVVYKSSQIKSLNIVGLRRAGYREHIKPLQRAFSLLYKERLANTHVAEAIERELGHDELCLEFARFIRGSRRGITEQKSDK